VPHYGEDTPATDAQLSAELCEPENLGDIIADELDMTTAKRTAIGLCCRSMPEYYERQALEIPSRDVTPLQHRAGDESDGALGDSRVRQSRSQMLVCPCAHSSLTLPSC